MPHAPVAACRALWQRLSRRWSRRAVAAAVGLIGRHPRLGGVALRTLLDRRLAPGVLCRVPFEDHALYVDPRDDKVALKLLSGRAWQRRELETAIAALREAGRLQSGGIFIDVGANIGTQTIYALRSKAFARAIAIEPDPQNFEILQRNLAANGLEHRVQAIAAAASATSGRMRLTRHAKNHGAHSVEAAFVPKPAGSVDVTAVSLDDLLGRQGVAAAEVGLVKIDVEGHELAVLEGMGGLRRAGAPIIVELTIGRADSRVDAFKALLLPHYAHVLELGVSGSKPAALHLMAALASPEPQADLLVF